MQKFGVHSEVGKLRTVLVCRPGLAHLQHEIVMILLRFVHPEDIVEEQISGVARGQTLMGKPGPADQHRPQLADFAVYSELLHCMLLY